MEIKRIDTYDPAVLDGLNALLPQLSDYAPPLTEHRLKKIIEFDASHLFVATEKDTIVGSLTLTIYHVPTGTKAWIEDVVVGVLQRGKGTGRLLMQHAIEYAKQLGADNLNLTSRASREAANRLYQRTGFQLRETNVYKLTISEK